MVIQISHQFENLVVVKVRSLYAVLRSEFQNSRPDGSGVGCGCRIQRGYDEFTFYSICIHKMDILSFSWYNRFIRPTASAERRHADGNA